MPDIEQYQSPDDTSSAEGLGTSMKFMPAPLCQSTCKRQSTSFYDVHSGKWDWSQFKLGPFGIINYDYELLHLFHFIILIIVNSFWTPGSPEGVLSNRPCRIVGPFVRLSVSPSLNISETVHCFFLTFCIKLGRHKDKKVMEPDFVKKILWGHKWRKNPIFWAFLMFLSLSLHPVIKSFWNFIYIISSTLFNI